MFTNLHMYERDEKLYLLKIRMHLWVFTMGAVEIIVIFWILTHVLNIYLQLQ